ncbi:hypothetical protein [Streptomyces hirsutus]|uniref:hypothetical protein n=1 Tax=Streptomyces hirsutus TaxID=35620 RepID=UPI0033AC0628
MPERVNGATDGGVVGQRPRRFQERFEPAVTRFVLPAICVTGLTAQFVQPVGTPWRARPSSVVPCSG